MEVASHYQFVHNPVDDQGKPADRLRCRLCKGLDFDIDMRQGDRICRKCGAVQNVRNIESHEEEYRTFADDDKKESKMRIVQTQAGVAASSAVASSLAQAQSLAMGQSEAEDGLTEKDRRRMDQYKDKVGTLATILEVQGVIVNDARHLCEQLVHKQHLHECECGRPGSCRLSQMPRNSAIIAAAILKKAMKDNREGRLFEEMKFALKAEDVDAADAKKVGNAFGKIEDLLKGTPFPCAVDQGVTPAAESGSADGGRGGASSSVGGGATAGGDAAADGEEHDHPAISLVPRLRTDCKLPFYLEQRAKDIIEDWQKAGMPAIMPQSIASIALLRAYDELVAPAVRRPPPDLDTSTLPHLDIDLVASKSGMAASTIKGHLRHASLPWPTQLLTELKAKVVPALGTHVRESAQWHLEYWLARPQGPMREWSRDVSPRVLAACALYVGSSAAGLEAFKAKGRPSEAAAAAAAAAEAAAEPPVSIEALLDAVRIVSGSALVRSSLETALAALPASKPRAPA